MPRNFLEIEGSFNKVYYIFIFGLIINRMFFFLVFIIKLFKIPLKFYNYIYSKLILIITFVFFEILMVFNLYYLNFYKNGKIQHFPYLILPFIEFIKLTESYHVSMNT